MRKGSNYLCPTSKSLVGILELKINFNLCETYAAGVMMVCLFAKLH